MKYFRIFVIFLLLGLTYLLSLVNQGQMPGFIAAIYRFPNGDKLGHFFVYGLLAVLVNLSLNNRCFKILGFPVPIGSVLITFVAIVEEYSQFFSPYRTPSIVDLASGIIGIAVMSSVLFLAKLGTLAFKSSFTAISL